MKIKEFCIINNSTISQKVDCEILYLDTSSITNNEIEGYQSFMLSKAPSRAQRKVQDKTILYSCVRPNLRHFGILKNPPSNLVVSTGFATLDVKDECVVDPYYLYYWLSQESITNTLHTIAQNAVSSYPSINPSDIGDLEIDLPPINIQRKIGAFLDSLDRKISLNRSINAELERMAKEIYDYWFVQFEFPDANGRPYKSSGGAMVYNPVLKREVPEGWEVKTLSQLGSFRNGINYAKDEIGNKDYRIANVRNVSSSTLFLNTLDLDIINLKQELADKYLVKPNDILITRSGCPGATRIIQGKSDFPIIFCGFIICFTVEDIDFKHFLTYQLKQLEDVTKGQSGGSILSNISQDVLKNLCVVIPPKSIVKTFNYNISKIWNLIDTTIEQSNEIKNQRDELLPLLMTGQVKIK